MDIINFHKKESLTVKSLLIVIIIAFYGSQNIHGQDVENLNLIFSNIDSGTFSILKQDYSSGLEKDTTIKTLPDSSFTLQLKNESEIFECAKDYNGCYYYKGYLPSLNSHIITHCSMYSCETFLLNHLSGKRQYLPSPFDNECESPVIAKSELKLLIFASSVLGNDSFIGIYERSNTNANFDFTTYKTYHLSTKKIFEIIWIDDVSFALKTFQGYGGKSGNELLNVKYIQVKIK